MTKDKLVELLNANDKLLRGISIVINYGGIGGESVNDLMDRDWTREGSIIYYDVSGDGDMYEYCGRQISSLGTKGEELFCGKSDGIFYAMAHEEDGDWDDTEILIFDMNNFKEFEGE